MKLKKLNDKIFLQLSSSCKKELLKLDKEDLIKNLFGFLGKRIKYSLESFEKGCKIKTPSEVWKTKKGHCFELSYFLIACLTFLNKRHNLKLKIYYLEQPNFKIKSKVMDHASVMVIYPNKKKVILDLGRKIFDAKYKKYNKLSGEKIIGNYFIDCATTFYLNKNIKKSVKYAKEGLKYYPNSIRAKNIIKKNK